MAKPKPTPQRFEDNKDKGKKDLNDILPLLKLLSRQPPKDHDFKTCPICKQHGIKEI